MKGVQILIFCSFVGGLCSARSKHNPPPSQSVQPQPSTNKKAVVYHEELAPGLGYQDIYRDGSPLHPDPDIAKVLGHNRPSSPQRCFFVVASCQIKAKNGHWDKLDCLEDNKVIDCCQFECTQKKVAFEKAKEAYQKIIEGETKATLDQLQKLENQRKKILHQLKNARDRVVKITQPSNDPRDFFTVASLPQQTKDELMTLAQVAQAVIHSKVHLEPEIQEDLEQTLAENLVELTKEAMAQETNENIIKVPEEFQNYDENYDEMSEEELEQFIKENDIMTAQDPFSKFLRKEMGN